MKELALFLVGIVVVCVIIAKVTGLHDVDTSERGTIDGTVPVAKLMKRDRNDIEFKRVAVTGTAGQLDEFPKTPGKRHLVIEDGDKFLYCSLTKDTSYTNKWPTEKPTLVVEGVVTYVAMINGIDGKESDQLVLRDCKIK